MIRRITTVSTDYFQVLIDHGLMRSDLSMTDLLFEMGAMTIGFFTADSFLAAFGADPDLERKADLLEDAIRRAFSLPPTTRRCGPLRRMVIEMFEQIAQSCASTTWRVRTAAPSPKTGEES